jgi:hypothetical protein
MKKAGRKASDRIEKPQYNKALQLTGAIACFPGNFFPLSLSADRAPQLKASVRRLQRGSGGLSDEVCSGSNIRGLCPATTSQSNA